MAFCVDDLVELPGRGQPALPSHGVAECDVAAVAPGAPETGSVGSEPSGQEKSEQQELRCTRREEKAMLSKKRSQVAPEGAENEFHSNS